MDRRRCWLKFFFCVLARRTEEDDDDVADGQMCWLMAMACLEWPIRGQRK